jgi:nucleoside 2-deoxyribosyltransferase
MVTKAYLAGPDVFLPDAADHARRRLTFARATASRAFRR